MHRRFVLAIVTTLFVLSGPGGPSPRASQSAGPDGAALIGSLQTTAEMWNRGDIDGFMAPYAESATYMTPAGLIGVDAMRARYVAKYFTGTKPDQQLRFDQLEVRALGTGHALMTGRFTLAGGGKAEQTGRFSLVWLRTPGGWRILHDHSS
jgi:ketosteroid isomerase-like protein